MLFKSIVLAVLVMILVSLGKGLFHLSQPGAEDGGKLLQALTWRIGLSVLLFVAILAAYYLGWIHPN